METQRAAVTGTLRARRERTAAPATRTDVAAVGHTVQLCSGSSSGHQTLLSRLIDRVAVREAVRSAECHCSCQRGSVGVAVKLTGPVCCSIHSATVPQQPAWPSHADADAVRGGAGETVHHRDRCAHPTVVAQQSVVEVCEAAEARGLRNARTVWRDLVCDGRVVERICAEREVRAPYCDPAIGQSTAQSNDPRTCVVRRRSTSQPQRVYRCSR